MALQRAQSAKLSEATDIPNLADAIQVGADATVTGDRRAFGSAFGQRIGSRLIMRLREALKEILANT